jgi:hypothetical protein
MWKSLHIFCSEMAQQLCEQFKGLRYQPYVKLRRVKVKPGQIVYLRRPTKLLNSKYSVKYVLVELSHKTMLFFSQIPSSRKGAIEKFSSLAAD